jgi:hypothetical protein
MKRGVREGFLDDREGQAREREERVPRGVFISTWFTARESDIILCSTVTPHSTSSGA